MPSQLRSADTIAHSSRTDVFLGVVAPVGVRRDVFEAKLQAALKAYGYGLRLWRLSELLEDFTNVQVDGSTYSRRLTTAMDAGTKLRERVGHDCLARAAMLALNRWRSARAEPIQPMVHVFWSLKHPEEVATLRLVYAGGFHLLALYAREDERLDELLNKPGMTAEEAQDHIDRDRDESGLNHGQRTRDTFQLADVFVRWGKDPDVPGLERFLSLLFGCPTVTPTEDEHRMFLAFASALRSGELSRQVGAALVSPDGDVLALGANDVPRRGGGLYWPDSDDERDYKKGGDSNEQRRDALMRRVAHEIGLEGDEWVEKLGRSSLRQITEYGRAVHAEMDALIASSRMGRSARDATLYVTTYPCHNCARHIIAAGVRRVVFVEPYPKSLAMELHPDDVVEVGPGQKDEKGRVCFEPFVGVGPRRFFDYFSMSLSDGYLLKRKEATGRVAVWDAGAAAPRVQLSEETFIETEKKLFADITPFQKGVERGTNSGRQP